MNDIRIKVGLCDHPKTKRLIRSAGHEAFFCLIRMWLWFRENRPKGNTDGLDDDDIEAIADWRGETGSFASALRLAGFMDTECLHGWSEHQTWAMKAEEREEQGRKAAAVRWAKPAQSEPMHDPCCEHIVSNAPSPFPLPRIKTNKPPASEKALSLSNLFAQKILSRNPAYRMLQPDKRDKTIERWSADFDKTHTIDHRDWGEMERVLAFSQTDSFWQNNILSANKFRAQYDKLLMKMPQYRPPEPARRGPMTEEEKKEYLRKCL